MLAALFLVLVQSSSDRASLIDGVDSIVAPGALPSAVLVTSPAFVIMRTGELPTVAAGPVGAGRAIVSGHGGFFSGKNLQNPSNAHLFANSLEWLAKKPIKGLRVGALGADQVESAVSNLGAETVAVNKSELRSLLPHLDILLMGQGALDGDEADQRAVMAWTKQGHGLYTAGPGWGWQQLNPTKNLRTDLAANKMLLPYGLGLTGEFADGSPTSAGADSPVLETNAALGALRSGQLSTADASIAGKTISRALTMSLTNDKKLLSEIERLASEEPQTWPITEKMPFLRIEATIKVREWEEEAPEKVRADPRAASFPGTVPADAKRIKRSIEIDTKVPRWHGLGLYAAPGEVITITVPSSVAESKGYGVRIGSHTDTLWNVAKWNRFPEISHQWPLKQTITKVASPFGGTIFIDVPADSGLGNVEVVVDGAVQAPRYVRGETTPAQWAQMRAEPGGPWVELEAHKIILSVPRTAIANLDDPETLMAYWDEVADLCYGFFAAPARPRAERYCVDRQISLGYMHSGYPIMTFEDVATTFTDVKKLRSPVDPWGFYHELGHNFQESAWTFAGTGEVTNNLFSLYACQKINGLAHPGDMRLDKREARTKKYLESGAHFADWQKDPFLALVMYDQIREAFGWGPFTKTFADYREQRFHPKGEVAQHDQWMIEMSKNTGHNLGPFFKAWGVPVSENALASITNLPGWMPADWPITQ